MVSHRTESRCPNLWGESNTLNPQNHAERICLTQRRLSPTMFIYQRDYTDYTVALQDGVLRNLLLTENK